MIFIIDNDEAVDSVEFIEANHEIEILGTSFESILLAQFDHGVGSKPKIIAIANEIKWINKDLIIVRKFWPCFIIGITDDFQSVYRKKGIPPLTDIAIEYVIECYKNNPRHKFRYEGFVDWDDVRLALSDGAEK